MQKQLRPPQKERARKAYRILSFLSISVNQRVFLSLYAFEIGRFATQLHVIIDEFGNYRVFTVGQDKSHFPIFLSDDGHHAEVIDIDIRCAKEIVERMNEDVPLVVFDAKLSVFLKHFMEFDVFFLDALQIGTIFRGLFIIWCQ